MDLSTKLTQLKQEYFALWYLISNQEAWRKLLHLEMSIQDLETELKQQQEPQMVDTQQN